MDQAGLETFEQFVNGAERSIRGDKIRIMFNMGVPMLVEAHLQRGSALDHSNLLVFQDSTPQSDAIFGGRIRVSTGLVDAIMNDPLDPYGTVYADVAANLVGDLDSSWRLFVPFGWILLHEFVHGMHQHSEAERRAKKIIAPNLESQATERDADLVAVAMVYRHLQRLSWHFRLNIEDDCLRSIIYLYLHRLLAHIPTEQSGSHPPAAVRLFHLFAKLVTLAVVPGELPDVGVERQETKDRSARMHSLVRMPCWDVRGWSHENIEHDFPSPIIAQWEAMKDDVGDLSAQLIHDIKSARES